jgi:hypothetical protein
MRHTFPPLGGVGPFATSRGESLYMWHIEEPDENLVQSVIRWSQRNSWITSIEFFRDEIEYGGHVKTIRVYFRPIVPEVNPN